MDIWCLRQRAFIVKASPDGHSLLSIFESPNIPKVFFDVRNNSDTLFSHYNVKLAGVIDLQLMQLATSFFRRKYVTSLDKCIEKDASLTSDEY